MVKITNLSKKSPSENGTVYKFSRGAFPIRDSLYLRRHRQIYEADICGHLRDDIDSGANQPKNSL